MSSRGGPDGLKAVTGFASPDGSAQCLKCHARNPAGHAVALGERGTYRRACTECGRSIKKVWAFCTKVAKRSEAEWNPPGSSRRPPTDEALPSHPGPQAANAAGETP